MDVNNDPVVSLVAIASAGTTVALACWLGLRVAAHLIGQAHAAREQVFDGTDIPCEQAAMPALWRLAWPLIRRSRQVLAWATRRPPARPRQPALDRAGLPGGIDEMHIAAARVLAAIVFLLPVMACTRMLGAADESEPLVLCFVLAACLCGMCVPGLWLRARTRRRVRSIERELPFFLDLLALCVQGGLSLQGAVLESVRFGPRGVLRDEMANVLAELRAGRSRVQAFESMSHRCGSKALRSSVAAILQAEALGISLGNQLKEQAQSQTNARFDLAERRALKAPVKLLLPLMLFIFPCTFIVIGFPIFVSMRQALT